MPEKPDALECTADSPSAVLVSWKAPLDGGAAINAYQLQRDDGDNGDFEPIYNGTDCQYTASGLRSGLAYRFRVAAENEVGFTISFGTFLSCCGLAGRRLRAQVKLPANYSAAV